MKFKSEAEEKLLFYWENYKKKILIGVQVVILLLFLLFIVSVSSKDHAKDVTADEILQVFSSQEGFGELMESNSVQLRKNYNIDAISCDVVLYYYMNDLMDVTEFVVLNAKDTEFLDAAYDKAQVRIADELTAFSGYSPTAVELLNNACVKRVGNYLFVAVSEHADAWEDAFLSLVQG